MGAPRHYDGDQVLLTFMAVNVTELAQGSFLNLELDEDDWTMTKGHQGTVLRAKNPNATATLTFQVMQGSPDNDALSNAAQNDYVTGLGAGPAMIKDLNGTTLSSAATSWLKKRPALKLGTEGDVIEYVGVMAGINEIHVGSNRLV
jgi:hypothetical protein